MTEEKIEECREYFLECAKELYFAEIVPRSAWRNMNARIEKWAQTRMKRYGYDKKEKKNE